MKYFEKIFYFLFPLTYLKATPWENTWHEIEKGDFVKTMRIFFSITLFGYILHYHTVDVAEGLAPSDLWFNYRYGMAAVSLLGVIFYSFGLFYNSVKFYRLPAILALALFCYLQARTTIWYPKVPYLYSFAFILAGAAVLRASAFKSVMVGLFISVLIYPTLVESKVSSAMAFSGIFFTLSVIIFSRSKYASDIKYFIATQKNIDQQKQIIEMNMEFTNQIKSFLPGVISRRLLDCIQGRRMGVSQAIHQILMPKKQEIACLFSDIRGFTKNSNDLNGFVTEAMFPEVVECTNAIEIQNGISRKVGDLIFAYFDQPSVDQSIANAFSAAIEISKVNRATNARMGGDVLKRFILLSFGEAVVGNLSGYSSSIEITAIGRPVNLLSRIDEITKRPELQGYFETGDIIVGEEFLPFLDGKISSMDSIRVPLKQKNIFIRDFEEINDLYVLRFKVAQGASA